MNKKETSLCFSGHRSKRLPQRKKQLEELKDKIWEEVDKAIKNGFYTFYFGGCYGFDLMCAQTVLIRKKIIKTTDPKEIKLIGVIPFEEQASNFSEKNRELYYNILSQCDDVIMLNTSYVKGCYFQRNRYMVDNSNVLICYYDGGKGGTEYTVQYAEKNNLKVINLHKKIENKN